MFSRIALGTDIKKSGTLMMLVVNQLRTDRCHGEDQYSVGAKRSDHCVAFIPSKITALLLPAGDYAD